MTGPHRKRGPQDYNWRYIATTTKGGEGITVGFDDHGRLVFEINGTPQTGREPGLGTVMQWRMGQPEALQFALWLLRALHDDRF